MSQLVWCVSRRRASVITTR